MKSLHGQRVLVTGPTGFIGRQLVRRLLEIGAVVHLLAEPGTTANLSSELQVVGVAEADITHPDAVQAAVARARPQVVFHLAALVSSAKEHREITRMMMINHQGTLNVLDAATELPGTRVVQMGSCEEYGDGPVPFTETQRENPLSPYALSKVAATNACTYYHRAGLVETVILRPSVVYGPGESRPSLIRTIVEACLAGRSPRTTPAEQTRDFVYIDDVVDACMLAAMKAEASGQIINIASGQERRLRDVIEAIRSATGCTVSPQIGALAYRQGEIMRYVASAQKAARTLEWIARTTLEDGLARIAAERPARASAEKGSGRQNALPEE